MCLGVKISPSLANMEGFFNRKTLLNVEKPSDYY